MIFLSLTLFQGTVRCVCKLRWFLVLYLGVTVGMLQTFLKTSLHRNTRFVRWRELREGLDTPYLFSKVASQILRRLQEFCKRPKLGASQIRYHTLLDDCMHLS